VRERGECELDRVVSLQPAGFIPVPPGKEPGFDHADVWLGDQGARMYVAHTGADRVDVLDCNARTFLRSIEDLPGVAGVLIDQEHDLLFTSDRSASRVSIFRCSDETLLGQVEVGPHPNGLAYDPRRRRLHSFNLGEPLGEGCSASVIDVDAMKVVAEVALPGRPRWAAYDQASDLIYANIRDPAVILRLDPAASSIVGAIAVPVEGPHGLWIKGNRLYCAADGGALVVIDRDDGEIVATLPLPGVPDVVWHDRVRTLYVAVGDPCSVTVIDTDAVTVLETVATEKGAHTLAWDPTCETLYVFSPQGCRADLYRHRDDGS
jgi:DNA-binding beta-propeller fold protein YncE